MSNELHETNERIARLENDLEERAAALELQIQDLDGRCRVDTRRPRQVAKLSEAVGKLERESRELQAARRRIEDEILRLSRLVGSPPEHAGTLDHRVERLEARVGRRTGKAIPKGSLVQIDRDGNVKKVVVNAEHAREMATDLESLVACFGVPTLAESLRILRERLEKQGVDTDPLD